MAVTSLGYQVNKQPIAQSFYVDEPLGVYCTKVDLFFAQKDAALPVQIQIRPMVNGFPSGSDIIPGSTVVLPSSSVNVDTIGPELTPTTFTFQEPIFLKGTQDYALVVIADSKDYQIYIAEINEFTFGSTERRVNKQPTLGSLFYSQNGVTFTPSQNQDLSFKLYQAKFTRTTGNIVLHNASVPKKKLVKNPVTVTSGSQEVRIRHIGHGLVVGNKVTITGVDSAGVGGISKSSIEGARRPITKVDFSGYTFNADSAADSDAIGGGSNILITKNIPFSILYPHAAVLQPRGTHVAAGVKTSTGKSFAGSETAFQKLSDFEPIKLNQNNQADKVYVVGHDSAEAEELGAGNKSMDVKINIATEDSNVAPMIDMQRMSMSLIDNIIDKQDSSATSGFNVPISFVNETSATGGTSASKHLTKIVTLAEEAVGLKIIASANKPNGTDFQLFFRTATSDEIITDNDFTLLAPEANIPTDDNPGRYREHRFLAGGQNGALPGFSKFQIKIVMRSTNAAKVPRIKDLRIIALSV